MKQRISRRIKRTKQKANMYDSIQNVWNERRIVNSNQLKFNSTGLIYSFHTNAIGVVVVNIISYLL